MMNQAFPVESRADDNRKPAPTAPVHCPASLKQFPGKLHDLLTYAEHHQLDDVVGWVHDGRAFMVYNQEKLVQILPLFFGQTKFRSFQRQLNMWRFERVLVGPYQGALIHPCFLRGNKALCAFMSRSSPTSSPSHYRGKSLAQQLIESDGTTKQFVLGHTHDTLERTSQAEQLQLPSKLGNTNQAQQLLWAEYNRRKAITDDIGFVHEAKTHVQSATPSPSETVAQTSRPKAAEPDENWSLFSECLDRAIGPLQPAPGIVSEKRTKTDDTTTARRRQKYCGEKLPSDVLPAGTEEPASPEQVHEIFHEFNGIFEV